MELANVESKQVYGLKLPSFFNRTVKDALKGDLNLNNVSASAVKQMSQSTDNRISLENKLRELTKTPADIQTVLKEVAPLDKMDSKPSSSSILNTEKKSFEAFQNLTKALEDKYNQDELITLFYVGQEYLALNKAPEITAHQTLQQMQELDLYSQSSDYAADKQTVLSLLGENNFNELIKIDISDGDVKSVLDPKKSSENMLEMAENKAIDSYKATLKAIDEMKISNKDVPLVMAILNAERAGLVRKELRSVNKFLGSSLDRLLTRDNGSNKIVNFNRTKANV